MIPSLNRRCKTASQWWINVFSNSPVFKLQTLHRFVEMVLLCRNNATINVHLKTQSWVKQRVWHTNPWPGKHPWPSDLWPGSISGSDDVYWRGPRSLYASCPTGLPSSTQCHVIITKQLRTVNKQHWWYINTLTGPWRHWSQTRWHCDHTASTARSRNDPAALDSNPACHVSISTTHRPSYHCFTMVPFNRTLTCINKTNMPI